MEEVSISETESRYFGDLFVCCDSEKTGKVPVLKATEMFRSANLSNDVIRQITQVAGIPHAAIHMSRAQFYACLKLIAAHQAAVPLRSDVISSTVALPLPKFSWTSSPTHPIDGRTTIEQMNGTCPPSVVARRPSVNVDPDASSALNGGLSTATTCTAGTVPPPPPPVWRKSSAGSSSLSRSPNLIQLAAGGRDAHSDAAANSSDVHSSEVDSEIEHADETTARSADRRNRVGLSGSPEAWSTASDSPTPTNSVTERPWAKNTLWQGLFCEEQRQLLGTEEESSDRHSSDEDTEADLETFFQITPEQRDYYLTQFRAVQPDQNGLLSGPTARVFFEKSRIPVEELRHIWQLCDVTKDGALSLDEFTAAMHLVVLRRNNIPLPAVLPACLMPGRSRAPAATEGGGPKEADLLHLDDDNDEPEAMPNEKDYQRMISVDPASAVVVVDAKPAPPSPPVAVKVQQRSQSNTPTSMSTTVISAESTGSPHSAKESAAQHGDWMSQSKEWTKFAESPTSNVSSPGLKPVNFDMQRTAQAVVSDPLILHPVPVRVTPIGADVDGATMYDARNDSSGNGSAASPKHFSTYHGQRDSLPGNGELRAIQRPQPKKVPSKNAGAIPPPPQRESSVGNSDDAAGVAMSLPPQHQALASAVPPLPPPRPHKHARSSSLDLNKLKLNGPTPPEVPPRISPQIVTQASLDAGESSCFADFAHFPDAHGDNGPSPLARHIHTTSNRQQPIDGDQPTITPRSITSLQSTLGNSAFEVYRKPAITPGGFHSPDAQQSTVHNSSATGQTGHQPHAPHPHAPLPVANASASTNNSHTSDFEKRVTAINDSLRYVSFKQSDRSASDVMRHLREQNELLLRLCSDLTDELAAVHRKKEELKQKIDANPTTTTTATAVPPTTNNATLHYSIV